MGERMALQRLEEEAGGRTLDFAKNHCGEVAEAGRRSLCCLNPCALFSHPAGHVYHTHNQSVGEAHSS